MTSRDRQSFGTPWNLELFFHLLHGLGVEDQAADREADARNDDEEREGRDERDERAGVDEHLLAAGEIDVLRFERAAFHPAAHVHGADDVGHDECDGDDGGEDAGPEVTDPIGCVRGCRCNKLIISGLPEP